mmetsp:Transcript_70415/g.195980  ORF Transcript_70415/g.195980 Transcript_70415/m.195980 type:complete len:211 (-) Transcript_70415:3864-4496(-)
MAQALNNGVSTGPFTTASCLTSFGFFAKRRARSAARPRFAAGWALWTTSFGNVLSRFFLRPRICTRTREFSPRRGSWSGSSRANAMHIGSKTVCLIGWTTPFILSFVSLSFPRLRLDLIAEAMLRFVSMFRARILFIFSRILKARSAILFWNRSSSSGVLLLCRRRSTISPLKSRMCCRPVLSSVARTCRPRAYCWMRVAAPWHSLIHRL